ncbi:MAG: ABC transporter substrate-binding protein [Limnochordia bacterium]|jgi:multiple sugar transport system substrate-binding protein
MRKLVYSTLMALCLALLVAGLASAASPVTVTVIAETREQSIKWQTEMKEKFEAAHPGVTIDLVSVAGTGLVPKMQAMLAGGVPLDIGFMDPYLVVDWGLQGILEDLTPFVAKEQRQFREWYPAALDLYRVRGALYGLPQDLQIGAIFYNKDLLNEAGVGFPRVGWTYDDLRATALRLTRREADGTSSVYGFKIPTGRNYMPVIWSYGGDIVDNWADPTKFVGRTPEVANALQYLADLVTSGAVQDRVTHGRLSVSAGFMQQKIAMGQTNTVVMAEGFSTIKDFDWDVVPLPKGPGGHVPYINAIGWFVFSSSRCKAEALELLRFMTSNEALERRVQVTGLVPPSMRVFQTTWLPGRTHPANRHLLQEGFDKARSPFQMLADFFNIINRETLATIWGDQAVASAVQQMETQINALLKARQ